MSTNTPPDAEPTSHDVLAGLFAQSAGVRIKISENYKSIGLLTAELRDIETRIRDTYSAMDVPTMNVTELELDQFVSHVLDTVGREYRVPAAEITGRCREERVLVPRFVSIWIVRKLTGLSLENVGKRFNRDHAAILNAERQLEFWIKTQPMTRSTVDQLLAICQGFVPTSLRLGASALTA